jgi:hypothetical protein
MEEGRGIYRVLVGKPEGKRSQGRPRRKWADNITTDVGRLLSMGQTGLGWLRVHWRAFVNTVMNLLVRKESRL